MDRKPAVAGQFYPGSEKALKKELKKLFPENAKPRKAMGAIAPHAGYQYSGKVAADVFANIIVPKKCIILSPNHTGMGNNASIMTDGNWEVPTGNIPVDNEMSFRLLESCNDLKVDFSAHMLEHSLEVLLPFMLERQPELSIVPICLSSLRQETMQKIGEAIADVIKNSGQDILLVVSSDMNHYEDQGITLEKDRMAIDKVVALDATGLINTCADHRISMCGVIPVATAIFAWKSLGAKTVTLVDHKTSGDTTGDYNAVVGYAGFIIE